MLTATPSILSNMTVHEIPGSTKAIGEKNFNRCHILPVELEFNEEYELDNNIHVDAIEASFILPSL